MSNSNSDPKTDPVTTQAKDAPAIPPAGGEKKEEAPAAKKLPQLGALEDDDEFEDFSPSAEQSGTVLDALKNADGPGDHLWEDNWDDDDIEDDFTKQLRTAIAERTGADDAMKD